MAAPIPARRPRSPIEDGAFTRAAFILIAIGFIALFLLLPLITVFAQALSHGVGEALAAFDDPDARSAIRLELHPRTRAIRSSIGCDESSSPLPGFRKSKNTS